MLNILFINVNHEHNISRGAGYVVASLIKQGHRVEFVDTAVTKLIPTGGRYDVYMLSSMTMAWPTAQRIIKIIRQNSDRPIIAGGMHATIMGDALLNEVDGVVRGEGENIDINRLKSYVNWCIDGGLADLSKLPKFPWHLFPDSMVVQPNGFLYVHATRGCPYNCTYCCNGTYLKLYGKDYIRQRPVDQVRDELSFLKQRYNPKLFYFGDEMILTNTDYCHRLFGDIARWVQKPYGLMGRAEYLTKDTADMLAKTGCKYVGLGVECGDEIYRKQYLNRKMTDEVLIKAVKLLKKHRIFVTTFNMIGFPHPFDKERTETTRKLTEKLKPNYAQFSVFYPFPATKLYNYCQSKGLLQNGQEVAGYFNRSILAGYDGIDQVVAGLNDEFNPNGFQFKI